MSWLRLFFRVIARPLRSEPLRSALTAISVGLGVAVVVAIELAGNASVSNFQTSMETIAGQADFDISAIGGVKEAVVTRLVTSPIPMDVVPRIEDHAVLPDGDTVPLIGLDIVTLSNKVESGALGKLQRTAGSQIDEDPVWLGSRLFAKYPQRVALTINDLTRTYRVAGRVPDAAGAAADTVVVMDIDLAQQATAKAGRVDRIEIFLPDHRLLDQQRTRIAALLPRDTELLEAGTQTSENRKMLDGFRWNVRVLSYIALVVGAFLIYNTIAVSVVRRRNEIGVLRALGTSRVQVLSLFLGEAAVFGLVGGLLGVLVGRVLAEGAVRLMGLTVDGLYVSGQAAPIHTTWLEVTLGLFAGTAISLAAALAPALEAASVSPTEAMARGRQAYETRTRAGFYAWLALASAALAAVLSQLPPPGTKPWWGYLACVFLILAGSLLSPALVNIVTRLLERIASGTLGVEALLAARSLRSSLWRSAVLAAAVATAVAMMVSIGIMVGSFRQSVLTWLDAQLVADFYLRPLGSPAADRHPTIDVRVASELEAVPGVAAVDRFRVYEIRYQGTTATLAGGQTDVAENFRRVAFLPGADREHVMQQLRGHDAVLISEPFANKHHVRVNDVIKLPLAGQERAFRVLAIYYDYASERGYIVMDRETMLRYLPDPNPSNLAIYIKPGFNADQVRTSVEKVLSGRSIGLFASGKLREEAIRTFDRTFAITYALEAVAIAVAVMGVAGALLALVIDRRREIGLLRFLGGATGQIQRLILIEAAFIGIVANISGIVLGVALSFVLIFVINKQSFGWTIQLHWPVTALLSALTGVYIATVLSAFYPARVAQRLVPIEVIHEE